MTGGPPPAGAYRYPGRELDVFIEARNWKAYVGHQLTPFIGGRVLEVGAGIGAMTRALCHPAIESWLCLEPDAALCGTLRANLSAWGLAPPCEGRPARLADLPAATAPFDTILYLDVLEHLADDGGELAAAATRLAPGGHLVVLAPAHRFLFSAFDREIGHLRRYTLKALRNLTPAPLRLVRGRYLDSAGMAASLGNRLVLRAAAPSLGQIRFWDRVLVPLSRVLDPLTGYRLGKSVLAVWRRSDGSSGAALAVGERRPSG